MAATALLKEPRDFGGGGSPCAPPPADSYFFCFFSSSWLRICWFSISTRVSSSSQVSCLHFRFSCWAVRLASPYSCWTWLSCKAGRSP